jgi:hypothetical protein
MADAAVVTRFTRDLLDFLRRHLAPLRPGQFGPGQFG